MSEEYLEEEAFDRDEEGDEFEELTIENPSAVSYYKLASDIAAQAMNTVIEAVKPGASVMQLCALGDSTIIDLANNTFRKKKDIPKGIAHPTCISVNQQVAYVSPTQSEDFCLRENDVVKIYLGAHVFGLASHAGQTVICVNNPAETPVIGRKADVMCAAHFCGEAVLRMLRPGVKNFEIQEMIKKVAETFETRPVESTFSFEGHQWTMEGPHVIPNALRPDQAVDEFEISENSVYHISIMISSGDGKTKESDIRTTVFRRDPEVLYQLKMKSARQVFNVLVNNFHDFSFSLRQLDEVDPKLRLGLPELRSHNLLHSYPVTEEKESDAYIAHVCFTALVLSSNTQRLFTPSTVNLVSSSHEISDPEVTALLQKSVGKKKRKKKK